MTISDFDALLAGSAATAGFRADLAAYIDRQPAERVTAGPGSPRVKVLRAIAQLLHAEPALEIERVSVRGASGCADFVGMLTVTDAAGVPHIFDFEWNCEWKARQLGYVDGFGFPDQIRAAQEFGWQCFARWSRVGAGIPQTA
jgi:hypothetical protein